MPFIHVNEYYINLDAPSCDRDADKTREYLQGV